MTGAAAAVDADDVCVLDFDCHGVLPFSDKWPDMTATEGDDHDDQYDDDVDVDDVDDVGDDVDDE